MARRRARAAIARWALFIVWPWIGYGALQLYWVDKRSQTIRQRALRLRVADHGPGGPEESGGGEEGALWGIFVRKVGGGHAFSRGQTIGRCHGTQGGLLKNLWRACGLSLATTLFNKAFVKMITRR